MVIFDKDGVRLTCELSRSVDGGVHSELRLNGKRVDLATTLQFAQSIDDWYEWSRIEVRKEAGDHPIDWVWPKK